jgi:ribosomal protein S18 acetylase RimI-like enzyme
LSERADVWLGLSDLWVSAEHRRRGLAVVVLDELLAWGAERGATTAYLQVPLDNAGALALYERVGFTVHHTYAYLQPPGEDQRQTTVSEGV